MTPTILNLPGYRVIDVREAEHEYHVKAETIAPTGQCPACRRVERIGHGRVEIPVRDMPVHGKQVGVYVDARRLRCRMACPRPARSMHLSCHPHLGPQRRPPADSLRFTATRSGPLSAITGHRVATIPIAASASTAAATRAAVSSLEACPTPTLIPRSA
ncbi:MAG: transposase family protein [Betaproteobacteria bacterium]|nr:transposase family protein [Betaproteobacteria bacterium]